MGFYQQRLIKMNGILLCCLDESERDYSICASAVYSNPAAIKYVPVEHIDDEMIEHVIHSGEEYISLIPEECINDYHLSLIRNLYPYAEMFMDDVIVLDRRGQELMERIHAFIQTP